MTKISVIVPVYNAQNNIEKCVQSIANQSLRDIEILLINDGSTDNSQALCDRLASKDGRIRAFSIKNSGPATARNVGLDNAKGEYLAFCDDDDFIEPEALEYMYEHIGDNDVLCCGLIFDYEGESQRVVLPECEQLDADSLKHLKDRNLLDTMCNKLYRASFVKQNGICLPDGELYEDTAFNQALFLCSPKTVFCKKAFYHYMQKKGASITRRYNPKKLELMKKRDKTLKELETKLGGDGSFSAMYFLRTLLSCFTDCFVKSSGLRFGDIKKLVKQEKSSDEWKSALSLAQSLSKTDKIMKTVAKQNAFFITLFCYACYIFKYKTRKLFFALR